MESKDTAKCKVCQKMFKIDNAVISHSQGKIPNLKLILIFVFNVDFLAKNSC